MDIAPPFADVPHSARGHLGLFFYEATLHVIRHVRERAKFADQDPETVFENLPFLLPYYEELRARLPGEFDWNESLAWFREQRRHWEIQDRKSVV